MLAAANFVDTNFKHMISDSAKLMCGIIILTVPTIQYGGFFLLQLISGKYQKLELTSFQKSMFRAGHAHAGVLVLLSLIAEILLDNTELGMTMNWIIRAAYPLSAILVSAGFFAAAAGKGVTRPQKGIIILYLGVILLMMALIITGIALVR